MPQVGLETTGDLEMVATISQTPEKVQKKLLRALTRVGLGLVSYMKTNEVSGQSLGVRTGTGRRSITYRVQIDDNEIAVFAGPDLGKAPYMRMQNFGGTITPTHSRFLTIPLAAALTPNGVARFTAQQVIADPKAYGFLGTFFHGGVLFGRKKGGAFYSGTNGPQYTKSGRAKAQGTAIEMVPLFALRPFVKLPAHAFMENTLAAQQDSAQAEVDAAVAEALNGS